MNSPFVIVENSVETRTNKRECDHHRRQRSKKDGVYCDVCDMKLIDFKVDADGSTK